MFQQWPQPVEEPLAITFPSVFFSAISCCSTHLSQFSGVRERQIHCANQLTLITIIHQQSFNAIYNRVGCAAVSAGDDGRATTHRFKDDMTKTIGDGIEEEGRGFSVMLIEFISRESRHMGKHPLEVLQKFRRKKHIADQP